MLVRWKGGREGDGKPEKKKEGTEKRPKKDRAQILVFGLEGIGLMRLRRRGGRRAHQFLHLGFAKDGDSN